MAVADVQLLGSRSTGHEGAVETRKELTITFFSIRHANGGRVVRGYPNVNETTRIENGALAAVA